MIKMRAIVLGAIVTAALTAGALATPARASQIFVQQSTTATSAAGGDPNIITDLSAFGIGAAGNQTYNNPLLVVVGVLNDNGTPTISFSGCAIPSACPLATAGASGIYGLTANKATFTSGDAFSTLGLTSGGSENFTNWSSFDSANGFGTATSYTLYAFVLPVSLSSGFSPITVGESGAANGSFILAYSCKSDPGSGKTCSNGGVGQTVFTNTGVVDDAPTSVPEPGSLVLLGTALLGVSFFIRRRHRG